MFMFSTILPFIFKNYASLNGTINFILKYWSVRIGKPAQITGEEKTFVIRNFEPNKQYEFTMDIDAESDKTYNSFYIEIVEITQYLSIIIILIAWSNIIRTEYLIPNEKDIIYIKASVYATIANFLVNLILIPKYNIMGVVIGTIMAETIILVYETISVRNKLNIKKFIKAFLNFLVKGIIMFVIIYSMRNIIDNKIILIVMQCVVGFAIYILLNKKYVFSIIR